MPASQLPGRCWQTAVKGARDIGDLGHYPTADAARGDHPDRDEGEPAPPVEQLPAPCWVVTCNGPCAETLLDEDEGWLLHMGSRAEAELAALGEGWTVTRAAETYCPDDMPPGVEQVDLLRLPSPGQLAFDGTEVK
jgi:hypothetical protein